MRFRPPARGPRIRSVWPRAWPARSRTTTAEGTWTMDAGRSTLDPGTVPVDDEHAPDGASAPQKPTAARREVPEGGEPTVATGPIATTIRESSGDPTHPDFSVGEPSPDSAH